MADKTEEILARLAAAMEVLATRKAENDPELMSTLTAAMTRIAEAQEQGAEKIAMETRRANRPSMEVVPARSVFNFRGERDFPRPRLKCRMLIPYLVEEEMSTREEIELLNLLDTGEYQLKRNDGTRIKLSVKVDVDFNDRPSRLLMNHDTAFTRDQKNLMPPLTDWLRQILKQHKPAVKSQAAAVLTMDEEEAICEAALAAGDATMVSI